MKSALVMQTDFGVDNLSVATMRGVAMIVDPELRVLTPRMPSISSTCLPRPTH